MKFSTVKITYFPRVRKRRFRCAAVDITVFHIIHRHYYLYYC